jgi:hypothetical protein
MLANKPRDDRITVSSTDSVAFISDQADYGQPVKPYRLYYRRDPLGHRHVTRVSVPEVAEPHRRAALASAAAVHRNSPIFWIRKIQTPYLTIHNDEDDAVPWQQGIEFFTAMRRLGKEASMFTFNGEKHSLRNRDNMKYWTVHMDEFFDHYLLGAPRPEWMDKGVSYPDRSTRDVTPLFKPKGSLVTTEQDK